jgi:hypothetical protein
VPIYVKNNNSFEQAETIVRECPHCGAHAQLIPVATPSFEALQKARPRHTGIVFRCAACNESRFARVAVRRIDANCIELSSHVIEVERSKERFKFSYLPTDVERLFREALECYTADCYIAFGSMCNWTVRAALKSVHRSSGPHLYDLFKDVARVSEIDGTTAQILESVLFASEGSAPEINAEHAAVLIEIVKDMLYQCFVRTAKLKAAMQMRRYFAGEAAHKVTPISAHPRHAENG